MSDKMFLFNMLQVYLPGTTATTIGWGVTSTEWSAQILQKVDVPLVSNENCEIMYNLWGICKYCFDN